MNDLVRSDEYVDIELDVHGRTLISTWKGYVPSASYRDILSEIQRLIAEHDLRYWLSDSRKMGAILHEDTVWSTEVLGPLLVATGLKRLAILNSSDIIHQMAAGRMVEDSASQAPYGIAFFDEPRAARRWLKEEDKAVG